MEWSAMKYEPSQYYASRAKNVPSIPCPLQVLACSDIKLGVAHAHVHGHGQRQALSISSPGLNFLEIQARYGDMKPKNVVVRIILGHFKNARGIMSIHQVGV